MDWTGGTRRRYSGKGKGNAVVQKQKAHFAKVRAAAGYQVIPDTFRQTSAVGQLPPLAASAHGGVERARSSRQSGDSRGHGARVHGKSRSPSHEPERAARKPIRAKHAAPMREEPDAGLTAEEAELIANRERLLARDDWLGLAAARPVRIKFPSNREQERIGKRRRVDKRKKSQRTEIRTISPPFKERLRPFEPMMSGALPDEDIRIRVGTDALLSQTQRTRRSHNSANTSIRPQSTDFGPISEESMLLKADSDGFEEQPGNHGDRFADFETIRPELHEYEPQRQNLIEQREYDFQPEYHRRGMWTSHSETANVPENTTSGLLGLGPATNFQHVANMRRSTPDLIGGQWDDHPVQSGYEGHTDFNVGHGQESWTNRGNVYMYDGETYGFLNSGNTADPARMREPGDAWHDHVQNELQTHENGFHGGLETRIGLGTGSDRYQLDENLPNPGVAEVDEAGHGSPSSYQHANGAPTLPTTVRGHKDDDEMVWKDLMHVKQSTPSNASVAALRSSSVHVTQSTTSAWPAPFTAPFRARDNTDDDMLDLEDHHFHEATVEASHVQSNAVSAPISSPSPSHLQILKLAEQVPVNESTQEQVAEPDYDELWREFVVGSQGSSQTPSSHNEGRRGRTTDTDELLPARFSSSKSASDQFRSDKVTTGGSIYASHTRSIAGYQEDNSSQNTSMIGHATTVNPEHDGISASQPSRRRRRKATNIHSGAVPAVASRRQEVRKPTKYTPVPRVLTKASTLAPPKNIYDLESGED